MITISHSYAEGTLLEGGRKGDGTADILKTHGWRWFPSIRQWGIRSSREKPAKQGQIEGTATALRAAGFEVEVSIDNTVRAMEDSEADRAARMEARADALHAKAAKLEAQSDAHLAAADEIASRFAFGQPILVGHHSEPRARADRAKIERNMDKFCELRGDSRRVASAAASADMHMAHRENPRVVANRITRLEADRRKVQRGLDGYTRNFRDGRGEIYHVETHEAATGAYRERLNAEAAHLDEQLRYWREFLAADSSAIDIAAIRTGDRIKVGNQWWPVLRVNKTTVTVQRIGSYTKRVAHSSITGHESATVAAVELDAS